MNEWINTRIFSFWLIETFVKQFNKNFSIECLFGAKVEENELRQQFKHLILITSSESKLLFLKTVSINWGIIESNNCFEELFKFSKILCNILNAKSLSFKLLLFDSFNYKINKYFNNRNRNESIKTWRVLRQFWDQNKTFSTKTWFGKQSKYVFNKSNPFGLYFREYFK